MSRSCIDCGGCVIIMLFDVVDSRLWW